ncbi:hypothetical protein [Flavonifractor hominis]|uniref:Glycosyltransferase n=1 Tax=Flavonifractor hominis TaxID=3133178 RepID=A0ABV1EP68_9FIRM
MYALIYRIYFFLRRAEKRADEAKRPEQCVSRRMVRFFLGYIEAYYNLWVVKRWEKHPSGKRGITVSKREEKIIVSLTSFPGRIETVWITIESLLRQTVKPDEIILWLADTQFAGMETLPARLLQLRERGLTIRFCKDLRSHKKYFYTMQEYPRDLILLVDDDMLYPLDTVEQLLKLHKTHPQDVCTITGQYMIRGKAPSAWRNPYLAERLEHSDQLQIFSGSGSLYPPGCLCADAFDEEKIRQLCPYADDLWLTYMTYRSGRKITALYPWRAFPVVIYGTAQQSLWQINAAQGQNDVQWEQITQNDASDK